MKKLRKILGTLGVLVLMVGILVGCSSNNDRSTPDAAMENYMATVKAGDIEKSHEFMHGAFLASYTVDNDDDILIDEEFEEKVKDTKGYKMYQNELTKIYNQLEYEITDTHEREGFDQKEYSINLTIPDINNVDIYEFDEIMSRYIVDILSREDEDVSLEASSKMYEELANLIKNAKDLEVTVSGYIIFIENDAENNESEKEWIISGMDYSLFELIGIDKGL